MYIKAKAKQEAAFAFAAEAEPSDSLQPLREELSRRIAFRGEYPRFFRQYDELSSVGVANPIWLPEDEVSSNEERISELEELLATAV